MNLHLFPYLQFPRMKLKQGLLLDKQGQVTFSSPRKGLLTHSLLPYRIERDGRGIAERLSVEVTLRQSYLIVGRGCCKARKSALEGSSFRELLQYQLMEVCSA